MLAILAFIVMLSMYLGARNIVLNLRYENRGKRTLQLVECHAYDIDDITTPVDVQGLHTEDGFDICDRVSYQNANLSKYKHDYESGPLTIRNFLDPAGFEEYKFTGIFSFHDKS